MIYKFSHNFDLGCAGSFKRTIHAEIFAHTKPQQVTAFPLPFYLCRFMLYANLHCTKTLHPVVFSYHSVVITYKIISENGSLME